MRDVYVTARTRYFGLRFAAGLIVSPLDRHWSAVDPRQATSRWTTPGSRWQMAMGREVLRWNAVLAEVSKARDASLAWHRMSAGGFRCRDAGDGTCGVCGVAMVTCPQCYGVGYHQSWCSRYGDAGDAWSRSATATRTCPTCDGTPGFVPCPECEATSLPEDVQ